VLFVDTLRPRGNDHFERRAARAPNVLRFEFELILSGSALERPVNYELVRILPPPGVEIDARKRPFIVFDPRAGHGPGIGGMKHDSEIGVALAAGHSCYFVGLGWRRTTDVVLAAASALSAATFSFLSAANPNIVGRRRRLKEARLCSPRQPLGCGMHLAGAPVRLIQQLVPQIWTRTYRY